MLSALRASAGPGGLVFHTRRCWPVHVIQALSYDAKRPLEHHQRSLSPLPVPPLNQTLQRFLEMLRPLVGSKSELEQTLTLLDDFGRVGGTGERLQSLLEERASKMENWLTDWWKQVAYLKYRQPLVVHSSPAVVLPKNDILDEDGQLRFAAKLIAGALDFKSLVDNKALPLEFKGDRPLCMDQYQKLFSWCRVPAETCDIIHQYNNTSSPPKHVVVARNSQFFSVDVYHADGHPLSVPELYNQLQRVCNLSRNTIADPVGILTAEHRDSWYAAHQMLEQDEVNRASLEAIQQGIFMVCLDRRLHNAPGVDDWYSTAGEHMLHGCGSKQFSCNRWFDKNLQFIIGEAGQSGCLSEHTCCEALVVARLCDHISQYTDEQKFMADRAIDLVDPRPLKFNVSLKLAHCIEVAKQNLDSLVRDVDLEFLPFTAFGKNVPKGMKMSPDAFIQIALQLASYRLHGRVSPTYESGSLRLFHQGRTDTIRSASPSSAAFVKAMDATTVSSEEKVQLMRRAVQAHIDYTNWVSHGQGVDRHLLGLQLQAMEHKLEQHPLFRDPAFTMASRFRLSTSQVPSNYTVATCFGAVVPDGYGVCYNSLKSSINFYLSAFQSATETDASQLSDSLRKSLIDMERLGMQV
uniref:carnitine O-acetyltransferase-like isoform X2 n=1 Tax=Myxine glutinosa TaxID=7769 RepID=UPI00358F85D5